MNMIDVRKCLDDVVLSYRIGCNESGNDNLIRLIDVLEMISGNDKYQHLLRSSDLNLLRLIFSATERADYLFIADLLEYELPYSGLWKSIELHGQIGEPEDEESLLIDL